MKLQSIPRFTLVCYTLAIGIIIFVFLGQDQQWSWFDREWQVSLLVIAVIVGVSGSALSIAKQIKASFKKSDKR